MRRPSATYRDQQVVMISLLLPETSTRRAQERAKEIAAQLERETDAFNVCVDSVFPRRRIA